jgi:hypothetical protein
VPRKRSQLRTLRPSKPSVFGDGLPERLRSTSLALLGITAAAGLGLVGFVFHQDWPVATDLPIPGARPELGAVRERAVVVEATAGQSEMEQAPASGPDRQSAPVEPGRPARPDSRLAAAERITALPPLDPRPDPVSADDGAAANPAPPVSQPVSAPPTATPPSTPAPPPTPSPAPTDMPAPSASSVDEGTVTDRRDEDGEDEVRERERGRPKASRRLKPPPPAESEDASDQPPTAVEDEAGEGEAREDESEVPEDDDRSRGRGHGRHTR